MKELSIEEKAKAYDEAIERAKKWYNAPNIDKMPTYGDRVIEEIFPELKESEDERIRKELIKEINGLWENDSATWPSSLEKKNKYIAWLEKQGDINKRIQEEIEKQTKQQWKPEKQGDNVSGECNDTALEEQLKIWFEKGKCSGRDEVIFHPENFGLQKQGKQNPQRMVSAEAKEAMYDKPAWSEEDKARFESCIKLLQTSDGYDTINVKWLKSLKYRYTWKPSDEQIAVLEFIMEDIEKDSIRYAILNSVLEQLKKLKGE